MSSTTITRDDLVHMSTTDLAAVMDGGHPIAAEELDGYEYRGIGYGLPKFVEDHVLWKTFKKAFWRDPRTGIRRGWNIRIQQRGIDGDYPPMMKRGVPITFGHFLVVPARGRKIPNSWDRGLYLDYGRAGNACLDVARFTGAPLVAVNPDSSDLLLGWDFVQLGPLHIPTPAFWSLERDCPIAHHATPPRPIRSS